jgi:hypothetical protein
MNTVIKRNAKWKSNETVSNASPNVEKSKLEIKETEGGRKL